MITLVTIVHDTMINPPNTSEIEGGRALQLLKTRWLHVPGTNVLEASPGTLKLSFDAVDRTIEATFSGPASEMAPLIEAAQAYSQ
jgi:hypothetical protein